MWIVSGALQGLARNESPNLGSLTVRLYRAVQVIAEENDGVRYRKKTELGREISRPPDKSHRRMSPATAQ